jgi:hypothetical protein
MNFKENKLEFSVLLIIIGSFGLLFVLFKGINDRNPGFFSREVSYQMPRPASQLPPDFSLDGREVEYDYNNPFAKKPIDPTKKKAEIKKADVKKPEVKKLAQKKKTDEAKKPEVKVDIVEADKEKMSESAYPTSQVGKPSVFAASATAKAPPSKQEKKEKAEQRSAEQWRSLLNAQPTRENMDKMIAAYNQGEITSEGYYQVIDDLLKSQKSETQGVAVYGLNKTPSGKSFVVLAQHYESLNADVKTTAQQSMMTYSQASRVDALGQALSSGNSKVVFYAFQVLQRGISSGSGTTGGTTASGRGARSGNQGSQGQGNRYTRLIPIIQRLVASQDVQVAELATQVLSQLGAPTQGSAKQNIAQQDGALEESIEMSSLLPMQNANR